MLKIWITEPYSFDPMEHDLGVHHITQRPLLAPLVSQYKLGETVGVIAKSWNISTDRLVWTFTLRDQLTFSDGSSLGVKDVKRSLTRIAFLMKQKGSKSGLLEHIDGYENITSVDSNFQGLKIDDKSISFNFTKEPQRFLEKIGFGLYSVVHPDDYNNVTGEWKNPKHAFSSGPYELKKYDEHLIQLKLRKNFPQEIFPNTKFSDIELFWDNKKPAQIYFGGSLEDPPSKNVVYLGGIKNEIDYVKFLTWKKEDKLASSKVFRQLFRFYFYEELKAKGRMPTLSFIPLGVKGIKTSDLTEISLKQSFHGSLKIADRRDGGGWYKDICQSLFDAAIKMGLKPEFISSPNQIIMKQKDPDLEEHAYDIARAGTGVLIEQPLEDLRFMVQSKEGIRLPDPTGRLNNLVSKEIFDPQEMNAILWDDAAVWPVTHDAPGLWIDENKVDMSLLDPSQPPTEIALIQPR